MPFDRIHRQILSDGFWQLDDGRLQIKEIVPDGLHLSERAGNELADIMENLLSTNL